MDIAVMDCNICFDRWFVFPSYYVPVVCRLLTYLIYLRVSLLHSVNFAVTVYSYFLLYLVRDSNYYDIDEPATHLEEVSTSLYLLFPRL